MDKIGILFLPSGPGLSSGPARVFLEPFFAKNAAVGEVVFWDEPSPARGDEIASNSTAVLGQVLDSLEKAAQKLPNRFVILTESFGSLLAELFFDRIVKAGKLRPEQKLVGILHTPPVMDLEAALRLVLSMGAQDLRAQGKAGDAGKLEEMVSAKLGIGTKEFSDGVDLAFTSPTLLPRYFSSESLFGSWAGGFAEPRFQPDAGVRHRILKAIIDERLPTRTTFRPEVRTWVFAGAKDPYRPTCEFKTAVDAANAKRLDPIRFVLFENSHHYPFVDETAKWTPLFEEFLLTCLGPSEYRP